MGEEKLLAADMTMTEEQQSMPLREAVFMSLRKAILTGKLKPGERLTEVKLGKLLGTSRTPIREAIRKLELEGLVTIVPGSGARVSGMTVEDLVERFRGGSPKRRRSSCGTPATRSCGSHSTVTALPLRKRTSNSTT